MSKIKEDELNDLYDSFIKIKDREACKEFLSDLLTSQELEALTSRLHAAKLLINGETYQQVINETNISSATLARVSKCVKNGKGYNSILKDK